uniref:Type III effector HopAH1 n=1 Tax=Ganoderma boninense TaxID=34458 RepID=A0A5K1K010_9APHY|nr:Type III effector HopAH1 [Ganoderma boninense]
MHARASLTGNVVRAIQADKYRDSGKGISGNVQPHALHQVIAEHYKCLDADFCERISINHPDMTSTERTEGFAAWEEAAREYKATHPEASVGWNSQGAMARLRHYPAQFSIDGAIMVTVPVAVVDYPKKASDILRGLEFFETRAPGSISETSNGNIEIQLPLLLIKEQAQRIDDNDSSEEDSEEPEEEEEEEEELDIEGDSDEEEEEEGVPRHSTRNAQRIVIASAAWYLSRLQIEDFPVFGLVTCGEKGYLSQAWVSSRDNCCYVVDWNIQNDPFDLGSGYDRYSAFLSKLANHGQELESRFEGLEEYEEACEEDEDF